MWTIYQQMQRGAMGLRDATNDDGGAAAAAAAAAKPWFDGADPETVGHIQTRGWDKKTPVEAALEAVKAHREAQKFIGAPPEEVARIPKAGATPEEQRAFYTRLGAPKEATGYDFSTIKDAKGAAIPQPLADDLRAAAFEAGLTTTAATRMADAVVKRMDKDASETETVKAGKLTEERAKLAANWGANVEANKFVASQGAKALGFTPENIAALEGLVGYADIMEKFRQIGVLAKEDRFVVGGEHQPGVMSKDQAAAKKADLMKDTAWVKRYLDGGVTEKAEMTALNTLITA